MLELRSAIISLNSKNKNKVDVSFGLGINHIEKKDDYIFKFLTEKEKYLEEGSFLVDGISFIPYDENASKSLFFLAINSQNISVQTCFVVEKETKNEVVKNVQEQLLALKNLPLNNEYQKRYKVEKIISILSDNHVSVVMLDLNKEVNQFNEKVILNIFEQNFKNICCVVLDREPMLETQEERREEDAFTGFDFSDEITISSKNSNPVITTTKKKDRAHSKDQDKVLLVSNDFDKNSYLTFKYTLDKPMTKLNFFLNFLLRNIIVLFFLVLSLVGFLLTFALSPQYFYINNSMLGIMFVTLGCIFFALYIYNIFSCFDFIPFNEKPKVYKIKHLYATVSTEVVTILGVALFFIIYFMFVNSNKDFNIQTYNIALLIISIIGVLIGTTFPIFAKYYYRLFGFLKRKLSFK